MIPGFSGRVAYYTVFEHDKVNLILNNLNYWHVLTIFEKFDPLRFLP